MDDVILYTHPMSRGRTVRWMLEELEAPYRAEIVGYGPAMKDPSFLQVNPMGKVPAIRHGGVVVTETAAICAYLADAFPEAGLAPPPASPERGSYYRWLFFAAPLENAVLTKALGFEVPDDKRAMTGFGSLDLVLGVLERELEAREYLAGDRFTTADLVIGAGLGWYTGFGLVEPRPAFTRYLERVTGRPAFRRASAIDDALIAAEPGATSPA